jgi:death-on-curing protein
MTYVWVERAVVEVAHATSLTRWGGMPGERDEGAILSALARPENLAAYEEPDLAELAAAYLYGIAKSHGYVDGNKRTAWLVARIFIERNGGTLRHAPAEAVLMVVQVAAGTITESACAEWLRAHLQPR